MKICRPIYSGEYVNRLQNLYETYPIRKNVKNSLHRRASRFFFKFTESHIVHNILHVICPVYADRCLVLNAILLKYTRIPANCVIYFVLKLLVEIEQGIILCRCRRGTNSLKLVRQHFHEKALHQKIWFCKPVSHSVIVLIFYNLLNELCGIYKSNLKMNIFHWFFSSYVSDAHFSRSIL